MQVWFTRNINANLQTSVS